MEAESKVIRNYIAKDGKSPFETWFAKLRDKSAKAQIAVRIDRLRRGNFGDCKSVGLGVFELRIHLGPGYRVYFGLVGKEIVLLLGGGDKSTQKKDIKNAYMNFNEFNEGKNGKA